MPSVPIPWPTTALPGRHPGESQGTLVNAYAVKIGEQVRIRRTAGLRRYLTIDPPPALEIPRGQLQVLSNLLHAWDGALYIHRGDGSNTAAINGLAGSEPVTMAKNLRPITPDVVVVNEAAGAQLLDLADDTIKPYPGGSMSAVNSVEYYSGYFVFTRQDGTIIASELQSTTIEPGSEATAEYVADDLWRTKSIGSALAVMGAKSVEFWVDVASTPFPFQRSNVIDVGLISPWAVAGGSNEWENGLLWVSGDWTVRILRGTEAVIVSNDDVTNDIRHDAHSKYDLVAQVYVFNAQAIWSLTCLDKWTWEYNLTTGSWHKRHSHQRTAWRAVFATNYDNRWIAQDRAAPALQEIDPDTFDEDGDRLRFTVDSAPLKEFPANFRIPSLDIDMTVGLGRIGRPSPYETDPVVMVSWSHDGGANWGNPVARSMGKEGRYATKVTVNNLGRSTAQGVMFRLEVVDPVWVQLTGAVSTRTKVSRARAVNQ
jgi:hypothetical protein